ncbi:MAG TPA: zf-HC2 domain-containing protein [Isosphaeraceae bacterium]|nr:zf-HC2 domain-containing protein [Isosphaeraceae bacterium]
MNRLKNIWHRFNLPCEELTRLASESLDRDLNRLERVALRSHLLYCAACRRYLRQLKLVQSALERLATRLETDDPLPGPGLPAGVREQMKRLLKRN